MKKRMTVVGLAALLLSGLGGMNQAAAQETGPHLIYNVLQYIPQSELIPLGDPAGLGGTVLEGDVELKGRIDYLENGMMAGIFQTTTQGGFKVRIVLPFTEHGTVILGSFTVTDEYGNKNTYRPGDSYFVEQGHTILWEQKSPIMQKSFFNYTTP
ncbi:MAG TPA: cupin domain-containing protein [bacterium]|nr:cupin domain-containing protein [bacterium]HKY63373.1 cupin domain-containing protein [bacterium]